MRRRGFSLVELVVVLAIIGILLALTLPAVQTAREGARRTQCRSNLRQIGIAMHSYNELYGMFPPGNTKGFSFHTVILPQMDLGAIYNRVDFSDGESQSTVAAEYQIPAYVCPTDPAGDAPLATFRPTNYAGNFGTGVQQYDYNGIFQSLAFRKNYRSGPVRARDVTDGLSNTAAVSETLAGDGSYDHRRSTWNTPQPLIAPHELDAFRELCRSMAPPSFVDTSRGRPWTNGNPHHTLYNHVLRPNERSCVNGTRVPEGAYSAGSLHSGGLHTLFGDGHVKFVSADIDETVWRAIGSRDSGETSTIWSD